MLDRLISGAGAATDAADRAVRALGRGSDDGWASTRPGSVLVAVGLAVLAGILVLAGLEATDNPVSVELTPAAIATADQLGNRTYTTIRGGIASAYIETFSDDDGNGTQDAGETGEAWYYWLVDPAGRTGVTVRSTRPPAEIYAIQVEGVVVEDADYVSEDLVRFAAEASDAGVEIDKTRYIDATRAIAGTPMVVDLHERPPTGVAVRLAGSRLGSYLYACVIGSADDGTYQGGLIESYDVVVYDPVSKRAITVVVRESPEFMAATLTGMLRRDERAVEDARTTDGPAFRDLDVRVSDRYILDDGAAPTNAPLAFGLAAVLVATAGILLIGLAGGYLIYRRSDRPLPAPATTFEPGERLPLRMTGIVRTRTGRAHVRESPGELVRFVLSPARLPEAEAPPADVPPPTPNTTLILERIGQPHGLAVGLGELDRVSSGQVLPLGGARHALRIVAGTGPMLLSFDSEAERDRAAAELIDEGGLGPDGRQNLSGRGTITVGDERRDVMAGSLVFVAASVPHHLHDITARLVILVIFGPAEGRRA